MTQITHKNYQKETAELSVGSLPPHIQEGHKYTLQYLSLYNIKMPLAEANMILSQLGEKEMDRNIEIGEFIDMHIADLNAHLTGQARPSTQSKPSAQEAEWRDAISTLQFLQENGDGNRTQVAEWSDAIETLQFLLTQ